MSIDGPICIEAFRDRSDLGAFSSTRCRVVRARDIQFHPHSPALSCSPTDAKQKTRGKRRSSVCCEKTKIQAREGLSRMRKATRRARTNCSECSKAINRERITKAAFQGRVAAQRPEANAKRKATQRVNTQAAWDWKPSDQPAWLTKQYYTEKIQPILASTSSSAIADLMKVSFSYASDIRKGRIPHPRRWLALAELAGLDGSEELQLCSRSHHQVNRGRHSRYRLTHRYS